MQSEFIGDQVFSDPDQTIRDAAAERNGAVRVRVQPMILRKGGQYNSWRQVRWTLDCESVDEAFAARDIMRLFFQTLGRCGPQAVGAALRAAAAATTTTPTTTTKSRRKPDALE